ncbi:MAG: VOC family protein [Alphaproteobacteria bacterium]|nr:VOC family protein [Alphaproteobacteria bacterium]
MNPIHVTKLDHVVLRVADIEKSIKFYRDVLGFPEKRISDGLYQYQAGVSMIDLVPIDSDIGQRSGYGSPDEGQNVDHFALTLSEFDEEAIVAYLEQNDVTVERSGRRFGAQGYGPSVYFQDPDGNFVELKGPSEETP